MRQELETFLDGYIVTMSLAGHNYKWEVSEAIKTAVYNIMNERKRTVIDFFYHKEKEVEGMIYVYEYRIYDYDEYMRIKAWVESVGGKGTYAERAGSYTMGFILKNSEKLSEFFSKFMMGVGDDEA